MRSYPKNTSDLVVHSFEPLQGEYIDLKKRCIPLAIAKKFGLLYVPNYLGQPCLAATYYKDGEVSAYNIKPANYDLVHKCFLKGDVKNSDMFGSQTHADPNGRALVITEGHEDCACANMAVGDAGYNFTSLKYGANSVEDFIKVHYTQLAQYQFITLCFDNDKAGHIATAKFLELFNQLGKVKVAKLPLKDANEMVKTGKLNELKWAIIKAEIHKPAHIAKLEDYRDQILTKISRGKPWPWPTLNEINYGAKEGKCIAILAPPDAGKTTLILNIAHHFWANEPKWKGGIFPLEQTLDEIGKKLIGYEFNKNLLDPDSTWWDKDKITTKLQELDEYLYFYNPVKGITWQSIVETIYYFVNMNGVKYIVLDNLTTIIANSTIDGKRANKEELGLMIANKLDRLAIELNIVIILVCHTNNNTISTRAVLGTRKDTIEGYKETNSDEMAETYNNLGLTWQSGRIATYNDIDCGKTIAQLFDEIWIASRNMVSNDDLVHRTLRLDIAKCKNQKKGSPRYIKLVFDYDDGKLKELKSD